MTSNGVFLIKVDHRSRRRTRRFSDFAEAKAAADEAMSRPEMFRAVWITDTAGTILLHTDIR